MAEGRPRVLILGGGFAGVGAAQALAKADVEVVIVDEHDYHTFKPLLYQFATGLLEQTAVGHQLRDLVKKQENTRVHNDTIEAIDLEAREVRFGELKPLSYDSLVLGVGAEVNFFGVQGAADHAFPLYTLPDATRLKDHILERWEAADRDPGLISDGALNAVVVGGGPTGVETAGALAELYHDVFTKDYPDVPAGAATITLIEAGPDLFTMFKENLREYTREALGKLEVEVRTGEVVQSVEPTRVTLKSGTVLPAHTLVWGAGLQGNGLLDGLGLELQRGKRLAVDEHLRVPSHPEVYAVGDLAAITDEKTGQVLTSLPNIMIRRSSGARRRFHASWPVRASSAYTQPSPLGT
jgi:NADH dehydrogenase